MTISVVLSDISSDILSDISSDIHFEKPAACAKIWMHQVMIECNGGIMVKLSEVELKRLVIRHIRHNSAMQHNRLHASICNYGIIRPRISAISATVYKRPVPYDTRTYF